MDPAEAHGGAPEVVEPTDPGGRPSEGLLRRALAEVPDPLLMLQVGTDGNLRCLTALGSRPTAQTLAGLVGKSIQEILPPDALARFGERYQEAHRTREPVRYEERLGGDPPVALEATLTPIFDAQGRSTHVFWSARDVSQREAMATALRHSEERFQALFEGSSLGVGLVDPDGRFLEVNPALCEMVGRTAEQLLSVSMTDLAHPDDREEVARAMQANEPPEVSVEVRLVHERGEAVWTQATASTIEHHAGAPRRIMWQILDTTERRGLQERLAHQALHDSLTGLPNRALFLDRAGRALSRLDRNPGVVAVMVADIDRLDAINDAHGHEVGDRVLAALGDRLGESIRQADTIARLGGDEFGLLCEELDTGDDALALAERVLESIRAPFAVEGAANVMVSGTVGVALSESTADHPETLLRDATLALHRAKGHGRGSLEVFDESLRQQAARRLKTETDLQKAIDGGEFRVFYQPQVELESGTIVGVEVLARWQHPERGLVTPTEFIQLAEETGIILPLGQWVLEEACRQSEKWRSLRGGEPLPAWVNISPTQLAQPNFPDLVSKVLAEHGADPSGLCLEVTEGALLGDTGAAVATLRNLKDQGIRVGLDDFGMGFSSLAYLKRLPVDMLKLDRTFVAGLGTNPEDSAIAAAVINLAGAMGLTSIAEGVETPDQLAELRELGCDLAQGYFFSSPQPAEVMEELLTQNLRW